LHRRQGAPLLRDEKDGAARRQRATKRSTTSVGGLQVCRRNSRRGSTPESRTQCVSAPHCARFEQYITMAMASSICGIGHKKPAHCSTGRGRADASVPRPSTPPTRQRKRQSPEGYGIPAKAYRKNGRSNTTESRPARFPAVDNAGESLARRIPRSPYAPANWRQRAQRPLPSGQRLAISDFFISRVETKMQIAIATSVSKLNTKRSPKGLEHHHLQRAVQRVRRPRSCQPEITVRLCSFRYRRRRTPPGRWHLACSHAIHGPASPGLTFLDTRRHCGPDGVVFGRMLDQFLVHQSSSAGLRKWS